MFSCEAARKTVACRAASRRGSAPSSGGISGKTAAPSGISSAVSSVISAPGHGGNDAQLVAVLDRAGEVVEVADVLVVEVDVDKPADLAAVKEPVGDARVFLAQVLEYGLDRAAAGLH